MTKVVDSCFDDVGYQINGKEAVLPLRFWSDAIRTVSIRSSRILGDLWIPIYGQKKQKFPESQYIPHEFGALLRVDRYSNGCIFVDDIPTPQHRFQIGQKVTCKDNSVGKINRITPHGVCVKINDSLKMNNFRWFNCEDFPMELTLYLSDQRDLSNYEFAVQEEEVGHSNDISAAMKHSFSELNQFKIPCSSSLDQEAETSFFGVYVRRKPAKSENVEDERKWGRLQLIQYPADTVFVMESSKTTVDAMLSILQKTRVEVSRTQRTTFLNHFDLDSHPNSKWASHITEHPLLFSVTRYRRRLVIERLIVELELWNTEWIHRILEQQRNNKPMLQWLVEERRVSRLHDHYRVFMSKFQIKQNDMLGVYRWMNVRRNFSMNGKRGFNISDDSCFEDSEYFIDGKSIPADSAFVKGHIESIFVRNHKLFGKQLVEIQNVKTKHAQTVPHLLADAFKIDVYSDGSIFVDDIPSKAYPFRVGHQVKLKSTADAKGTVSRLTDDAICIEFSDTNWRWIRRIDAPKEVTLAFGDRRSLDGVSFQIGNGKVPPSKQSEGRKFSNASDFRMPTSKRNGSIGIYAKPTNGKFEWLHIKSIENSLNVKRALNILPQIANGETVRDRIEQLLFILKESDFVINETQMLLKRLKLQFDPQNIYKANQNNISSPREHPDAQETSSMDCYDATEWMPLITAHSQLFATTSYRRRLVIERLIVELGLWSTQWIHRILEKKMENKPMLQWLVENRKMNRLYDHYRVFMSVHEAGSDAWLCRRSIKFNRLSTMSGKTGFYDSSELCFKETMYIADGVLITSTSDTVSLMNTVRQISIRNDKLFGEREVVIHEFQTTKSTADVNQFVYALKVDQYSNGCVFVDNIPSSDYPFRVEQEVQLDDGARGKISRVTADDICIKMDGSIIPFRWITKKDASKRITLKIPREGDLQYYSFGAIMQSDIDPVDNTQSGTISGRNFYSFKDFLVPCSGWQGKQANTVIGVYAKRRSYYNYQSSEWKLIKTIDSLANKQQLLPVPAEPADDSLFAANMIVGLLLETEFEIRDSEDALISSMIRTEQKAECMSLIGAHSLLFDVSAYRRRLIIERLVVELKLWSPHWIHRIVIQKKGNEPMLDWLVKTRGVSVLHEHYRVCTALDVKCSSLLGYRWLSFKKSTSMEDTSYFEMSQFEADGVPINMTTVFVKDSVRTLTVRNETLFGERPVVLHQFEGPPDSVNDVHFVDALKLDQYSNGCIFVEDIPSRMDQFRIGQYVKFDNEANGTICRVTDQNICIKTDVDSKHSITSFRWISKSKALRKITLRFKHIGDLNNLYFAARVGGRGTSGLSSNRLSLSNQFVIPCQGFPEQVTRDISIEIYAKPRYGDYQWVQVKTLKYSAPALIRFNNSETVYPRGHSDEMAVQRLIMTLMESKCEYRQSIDGLLSFGLKQHRESKWMALIGAHPMLFDITSYGGKLLIERLIIELKLWDTQWIHRILKMKRKDKPMLQWLVEDRKVVPLHEHYRICTAFEVQYSSNLIGHWLNLKTNTSMKGKSGFDETDDSCFQMTRFEADGVPIKTTATTVFVKSSVRKLTARNAKLFGERAVVLHQFERSSHSVHRYYFVDALKLDQYSNGCIFVDDIPSRMDQLRIGQDVKLVDGAKGTISRVTDQNVCIKTDVDSKHSITSFRWISKSEALRRITLIFKHIEDLNNLYFAARVGGSGTSGLSSRSLSHSNQLTFPCQGFPKQVTRDICIEIYAKPRSGDYQWAQLKTLKYSAPPISKFNNSETVYPKGHSDEMAVQRLIMTLMESTCEYRQSIDGLLSFGLKRNRKSKWMSIIATHPMLFDVTAYRRRLLIERFLVELQLRNTQWIHRILETEMKGKPMLQWLVEDRKVVALHEHYGVYFSRFKDHYSPLWNRTWLRLDKNSKMSDSCFTETEYKADGIIIDHKSTSTVHGSVQQITITNTKLFGHKPVVLQKFDVQNDGDDYFADDFTRSLCFSEDHVFLSYVPSSAYPFRVGQEVTLNDGAIGKISKITADAVCVKLSNYKIPELQFVKADIPLSLTLAFRHKQKFQQYEIGITKSAEKSPSDDYYHSTKKCFSSIKDFELPTDSLKFKSDSNERSAHVLLYFTLLSLPPL